MAKPILLASSDSVAGLAGSIRRFYFDERYDIDLETLAITHPEEDIATLGTRVVRKGRRYRFEALG